MTRYKTIDFHTAGEPLRIITEGVPAIEGQCLLEKRNYFRSHFDHIRQALMLEPRGHAAMYGAVLTEPTVPHASAGVIFMHQSGYSTMCGHGTIAIAQYLIESGKLPADSPEVRFYLECPCDVVEVVSTVQDGKVTSSSYTMPSAHAVSVYERSTVPGFGPITYSLAYGGVFYAIVSSSRLGLPFYRASIEDLSKMGRLLLQRLQKCLKIEHPKPELAFLYGVILIDDKDADGVRRHLTIFGDGQIDRSPTGSGVSARMALDLVSKKISANQRYQFRGISGESFFATAKPKEQETTKEGFPIVEVQVEGKSSYLGTTDWEVCPDDTFAQGWAVPQYFSEISK